MPVKSVELCGFRGFGTPQKVYFGVPNGTAGSGLTILVGPNSGGKSSVLEALRYFTSRNTPSIPNGRRNKKAKSRINIVMEGVDGKASKLRTVDAGGANTLFEGDQSVGIGLYALPSRRYFNPFFGGGYHSRVDFTQQAPARERAVLTNEFAYRLNEITRNDAKRQAFNELLWWLMGRKLQWTIEMHENNQFFVKIDNGIAEHSTEGLGEGIVSLMHIADALFEADAEHIIVIDEPELSLHPAIQKRLAKLFRDKSTKNQIIVATHSPYFVDFDAIVCGAKVNRVYTCEGDTQIKALSSISVDKIRPILKDKNHPHLFGLTAKEAFFLDDGLILVEGQEDVVCYQQITDQLDIDINGEFFGWGVGGANKMEVICQLLNDLGFSKVVGLLDKNKSELVPYLEKQFPTFKFGHIPTDDVRTKPVVKERKGTVGILDDSGKVRAEYAEQVTDLFNSVNKYLES